MIIQCEQCRTKFRLDDSRVKEKGVKVRCAKCRHVFTVMKEQPEPLQETAFGALLDQSAGSAAESPSPAPFAPQPESSASEEAPSFDISTPARDDLSAGAAAWETATFELPQQEPHPAETGGDECDFSKTEQEAEWKPEEAETAPAEVEFAGFNFAGAPPEPAKALNEPPPAPDTVATPQVPPAAALDIPAPAVAPREEPKPQAAPVEPPHEPAFAAEEELPPLSIASRRKQSPLRAILLTMLLLLIAAALFFYKDTLIPEGVKKAAPQPGKITLRSIDASFVKNEKAGELLVITGEALNEFDTPRTAILVTGLVYGDNDKILASKNAYSGNMLTKEQLATMPLDKVEASMANQFGSALDNLEVAPGKAIPFMVVIANVPQGAKNFGAVQAGSAAVPPKK